MTIDCPQGNFLCDQVKVIGLLASGEQSGREFPCNFALDFLVGLFKISIYHQLNPSKIPVSIVILLMQNNNEIHCMLSIIKIKNCLRIM